MGSSNRRTCRVCGKLKVGSGFRTPRSQACRRCEVDLAEVQRRARPAADPATVHVHITGGPGPQQGNHAGADAHRARRASAR